MAKIVSTTWDKETQITVESAGRDLGCEILSANGYQEATTILALHWPVSAIVVDMTRNHVADVSFLIQFRKGNLFSGMDETHMSAAAFERFGSLVAHGQGIRKTPVIAIVKRGDTRTAAATEKMAIEHRLYTPFTFTDVTKLLAPYSKTEVTTIF